MFFIRLEKTEKMPLEFASKIVIIVAIDGLLAPSVEIFDKSRANTRFIQAIDAMYPNANTPERMLFD